jgi:hypothetical protein
MTTRPRVYLEVGSKRVFALALDWPGWARAGKDAEAALAALGEVAPRYLLVAREAGIAFSPTTDFEVVERVTGSATTDFGAPGSATAFDGESLGAAEAEQIAALVVAAWKVLDEVAAASPAELRRGPRGGGRGRDKMLGHVLEAEGAYAPKLGIRGLQTPAVGDAAAVAVTRAALVEAILGAVGDQKVAEKRWLPRYAARRIAWHALDHAWEMEDRRP